MGKIINILTKRWVQHLIGWSFFFFTLLIMTIFDQRESLSESILFFIKTISFATGITYSHFYTLRFIQQKKYLLYIISTIAIILIIGTIEINYLHALGNREGASAIIHTGLNILAVIAIGTGLKYIKKGVINYNKIKVLQTKQLKTEYNLLKAQVNPHFLFNTLNNMYSLSLSKDDKLSDMILELSDLMRYQLESSTQSEISLEDEINYLKNYVQLESIRVERFCTIDFQISGIIKNKRVAPLLFIPFVENAFKYSISATQKSYININFDITDHEIRFYIENSISPVKQMKKSTGMGIDNVKKRLEILYSNKHKLEIQHLEKHYSVELKIDLT